MVFSESVVTEGWFIEFQKVKVLQRVPGLQADARWAGTQLHLGRVGSDGLLVKIMMDVWADR